MKNYKEEFSNLHQYLNGLFHQDWKDVFAWKEHKPNYEDVVKYFRSTDKESETRKTINDLRDFLALHLSESEIEDVMDEWNIAFYPYGIKITYKSWLENILKTLEEPMEKTKQEFILEFIG